MPSETERVPGRRYDIAQCDTLEEAKEVIKKLKTEVPRMWYLPRMRIRDNKYIVTAMCARREE
jgi:hypothetical protein